MLLARRFGFGAGLCLFLCAPAPGTGAGERAAELYREHCASCHGRSFQSKQTREWLELDRQRAGTHDEDFARIIARGLPDEGMPAFASQFENKQIRALVVLIREHLNRAALTGAGGAPDAEDEVFSSREHEFVLDTLVRTRGVLWSMSFLPGKDMLLTEKSGTLYYFDAKEQNLVAIADTPEVWSRGQGGLLDVLAHPDYAENQWIYLAYSDRDTGMTAIDRGRIREDRWEDHQEIFRADKKFRSSAGVHFGTRMVIRNGYLYFGIGDRGARGQAQDLSRPNGKIHRIHEDGRVPEDNPFVDEDGKHLATIWTYGNRNPQGLTLHPDGHIWEAEHGPRGGDEINLIAKGLNYGWPLVSFGINYDGTPFAEATEREGMQSPLWHWTPSIAVSNLDFYEGGQFSAWEQNLLVASLARQELHRLIVSGQSIVDSEVLIRGQGRIRDVRCGPDGLIWLLLEDNGASRLVRMSPAS